MADTEITCALANCIPPDVLCLLEDCCGEGTTQNLFETVAVSGQSDVVADSPTDTLTLVAGPNVVITTDAGTDSITISATGDGLSVDNYDEVANFAAAPTPGKNVANEDVRDGYIFKALDTNNLWILSGGETTYVLMNQYTQKDTLANFMANIAAVISGTRVGAYEENQYVHIPDEDEWYKVEWVNIAGVDYNVPILQEWPDTTVAVQDEGVEVVNIATVLNFVGAGVTASDAGGGVADIVITGGAGSDTHVANTDLLADATHTHDFAGFNQAWTNLNSYTLNADTQAKIEADNVGGDISTMQLTPTTSTINTNLSAGAFGTLELTGGTFNLEVEDNSANNAAIRTLNATTGASTGEPQLAVITALVHDGTATNGQFLALVDATTGEVEFADGAQALTVEDEGIPIETNTAVMDFVGGGVTVTSTAAGEVEVNIPATGCATTSLTTAAFNALRAGSGLNEGCIYEINDHSQGYLVGALIRLKAVSATKVAMACDVVPDSSWDADNVWSGLYNVTINKVVKLTDNNGNTAEDWDGTMVGQFPWGVDDWKGNRFFCTTLTVEAAPASTLWRNTFEHTTSNNLTSCTGHMNKNFVGPATNLLVSNSELDIDSNIISAGTITGNSTAILELSACNVGTGGTVTYSGSKDMDVKYSLIHGQSSVTGQGLITHSLFHKATISSGPLNAFALSDSIVIASTVEQINPPGPEVAELDAGLSAVGLVLTGHSTLTNQHLDQVSCTYSTLMGFNFLVFSNEDPSAGDDPNNGAIICQYLYMEGDSEANIEGGTTVRNLKIFKDDIGMRNVSIDDVQVSLASDLFFNADCFGLDIVGPGGTPGPSPRSIGSSWDYITENEHHQSQMS